MVVLAILVAFVELSSPRANVHAPTVGLSVLWIAELGYVALAGVFALRLLWLVTRLSYFREDVRATWGSTYRPFAWAWVLHLVSAAVMTALFVAATRETPEDEPEPLPTTDEAASRPSEAARTLVLVRQAQDGCVLPSVPARATRVGAILDGEAEVRWLDVGAASTPPLSESRNTLAVVVGDGHELRFAPWVRALEGGAFREGAARPQRATDGVLDVRPYVFTCESEHVLVTQRGAGREEVAEIASDGRLVSRLAFPAMEDGPGDSDETSFDGFAATAEGVWFWDSVSSELRLVGANGTSLRRLEVAATDGTVMFHPHSRVVAGPAGTLFAGMEAARPPADCQGQFFVFEIDTATGRARRVTPCGIDAMLPAYAPSLGLVFAGQLAGDEHASCALYRSTSAGPTPTAERWIEGVTEPRAPVCAPSLP